MGVGGQWMTPVAGGEAEWVPDSLLPSAIKSGHYAPLPGDTPVGVTTEQGTAGQVPLKDMERYLDVSEGRLRTGQEAAADERGARVERQHGGALGGTVATAWSAVDSAFLGLPGLAVRGAAPEAAEYLREAQEAHPGKSAVAGVVGTVAPVLATGGTGLLAKGAAKTGVGLAERAGASVAAKLGGGSAAKVAGLTVEGGIVGAGSGLQSATSSPKPIEVENLVASVGSNAFLGMIGGGGVGLFGKAASTFLKRGKDAVDDALIKAREAPQVADEFKNLDDKGIREAVEAEKSVVAQTKATERVQAAQKVEAYHKTLSDSNVWLAAEGKPSAVVTKQHNRVRNELDNLEGLGEKPGKVIDAVQRQKQALQRVQENLPKVLAKAERVDKKLSAQLLDTLTAPGVADEIVLEGALAKRLAQFDSAIKVPRNKAPQVAVDRATAEAFHQALESGAVTSARKEAAARVPDLIKQADETLKAVKAAAADAADTPRLKALADAKAALSRPAPQPKAGLVERALTGYAAAAGLGMVPGGLVGAAASYIAPDVAKRITGALFRRFGNATTESLERSAKTLEAILDTGKRATKVATPLASKTLSSVAFAPPEKAKPGPQPRATTKEPLIADYQKREAELYRQVVGGQVTPQARMRISENLAAVRVASPLLADAMETVQVRRMEFLASKLPRRPDVAAMRLGPDTWQPSDMQVRTFARYVAAAENPAGVEERVAAGTVTPEDAEAYRAVFPERLAELKRKLLVGGEDLKKQLPYPRRLSLSILTGCPFDAALEPRVLACLQRSFKLEEGTAGGTSARTAMPQSGSVKTMATEPTPAQKRAG